MYQLLPLLPLLLHEHALYAPLATMSFALRVFFAGLSLLPLMVRCVPAPRERSSSVFPRAQGDPSASSSITGTLSSALEAAGTSTPFDRTVTGIVLQSDSAADSDGYDCAGSSSFLAGTAGSGAADADPRAVLPMPRLAAAGVLRRRSEAVLFLPPDTPPPSPNLSPPSTSTSTAGSMSPSTSDMTPSSPPSPSTAVPAPPPDDDLNMDASPPAQGQADGPDPSSGNTTTTTTTTTPTTPTTADQSTRPLLMAYYPDWAADAFPPEKVDFGRFDWIDFAFAVPDAQGNLTWDGSEDAPDLLQRLVTRAHQAGKNVKLSVGGWTGSRYFSGAAASPEGRTALASNILAFYQQFNLDGIDIDWEYPAQDGNEGNLVRPDDSANFLAFLQVLRATLPPGAKITAATQTVPFAGPDGDPMGDVSEFARVLDWVLLMNYDTWGSSDAPGPNAPLSDACNNSTQGSASALAALRAWTAAGFPASQLVLGVPSYGYISRSSASLLRTRGMPPRRTGRLGRQRRAGRRKRDAGTPHHLLDLLGVVVNKAKNKLLPPGQTLVTNEDGGTDDGQVQFRELVQQGVLQPYYLSTSNASSSPATADSANGRDDARPRPPRPRPVRILSDDGTGTIATDAGPDVARSEAVRMSVESAEPRAVFAGTSGFARGWDLCSSTPFLHSDAARQVVAYDDPVSLEMKAQLAREAGMRGVNMFDVHGDTDEWDLADALLRGLGAK
ncbi:hypothetical protein ACG7TL_003814 [Trametes sanguinea]